MIATPVTWVLFAVIRPVLALLHYTDCFPPSSLTAHAISSRSAQPPGKHSDRAAHHHNQVLAAAAVLQSKTPIEMEITQGPSRKLQTRTSVAHANEPPTLPQAGASRSLRSTETSQEAESQQNNTCFGKDDLGQVPLPVMKRRQMGGLVSSTTTNGDEL